MSFEIPAQFAQFGDARKNGFLRVKNIKENGGKVAGTFCTFTPQEDRTAGKSPVDGKATRLEAFLEML